MAHNFHGIFVWGAWDKACEESKIFYNVRLLVKLGEYNAETEFEAVYWDEAKLCLFMGDDDKVGIKFNLVPQ